MKRSLVSVLVLLCVAACGDDDDDGLRDSDSRAPDGGGKKPPAQESGVCKLSACPQPELGIKCCTPQAGCGFDESGLGLNCVPNELLGDPDGVCTLADCPKPEGSEACCTPDAQCGFDPFGNGVFCFGNPPPEEPVDAAVDEPEPLCDLDQCPTQDGGIACCQDNGECGVDAFEVGFCFDPDDLVVDGGVVDAGPDEPIDITPPDDPSVDGQCPSYLGVFGPVWGCCTQYGVCGTYEEDQCYLPVGAPIRVDPDDDGGVPDPYQACKPPPSAD